MKQNKYDDQMFFDKYSQMTRSQLGLDGAGEWEDLQKMLPIFTDKSVLDLGCGYGWHCVYAAEHGAHRIVGIDISQKMIAQAKAKSSQSNIEYMCTSIEDISYDPHSFDVVLSSLALHYIADFNMVCQKVGAILKQSGTFVFSCEHPIFTAQGSQEWAYDSSGSLAHWPVDNYFSDGPRNAHFLGENVVKYHRSLSTYLRTLRANGFAIVDFCEPQPPLHMMDIPGMKDELRRPMMMIISAVKL